MNINLAVEEGSQIESGWRYESRASTKRDHLLANHDPNAEEMCSSQAAGTREATDGFRAKKEKSLLGGRPPNQTFPHWLASCSEGTFLTL